MDGDQKDLDMGIIQKDSVGVAKAASLAVFKELRLHPDLLQGVAEAHEVYGAMPVDTTVFHNIRSGRNVYLQQEANAVPTYLVPIIQYIISKGGKRTEAGGPASPTVLRQLAKDQPIPVLVLASWPEAAIQVAHMAKLLLSNFSGYRVATAFPPNGPDRTERSISNGCDILVADPRALAEILGKPDSDGGVRRKLEELETTVVEGADTMVTTRSMKYVDRIMSELSGRGERHSRPQGVLISATDPVGPILGLADVLLSQRYKYFQHPRPITPMVKPEWE